MTIITDHIFICYLFNFVFIFISIQIFIAIFILLSFLVRIRLLILFWLHCLFISICLTLFGFVNSNLRLFSPVRLYSPYIHYSSLAHSSTTHSISISSHLEKIFYCSNLHSAPNSLVISTLSTTFTSIIDPSTAKDTVFMFGSYFVGFIITFFQFQSSSLILITLNSNS